MQREIKEMQLQPSYTYIKERKRIHFFSLNSCKVKPELCAVDREYVACKYLNLLKQLASERSFFCIYELEIMPALLYYKLL